jgi:hypothetical protein
VGSVVAVLMCAALPLAGCGNEADPEKSDAAEKTVETEIGDVTLKRDGEGVSVEARDGQFQGRFGADARLPEGFPEDVPVPAGARVVGAMTSREPGAEGSMVSLQSDGPADELLAEFRSGMRENGWVLEEESSTMGWQILHASKEGRTLIVQAMDREGGSHAMVHLGK